MSDSAELVRLVVHAEDAAAEVFVIDGAFRLVERGRGTLKTELTPGIYKVKARAGHETWERHVVLRPGSPEVTAQVQLPFASPVPLAGTSRWNERHASMATEESGRVQVQPGFGSIFVMAREWTVPSVGEGETPPHPMRGLSLRRQSGEVVAELAQRAAMPAPLDTAQPPAVCAAMEVEPGFYTLTLELASGRVLHQPVIATAGWQSQVFMGMRDYGRGDRRADLPGAAIHLSPGGFTPNSAQMRLGELARLAVANDRWVMSDQLKRILADKYENPMLGILSGHLLLMEPEPDLPVLTEVVNNLRGLLGAGRHPDVEALALRTSAADPNYRFTVPPMLRRSWDLVLEASAADRDLVPQGSLAESACSRALASEPWLTWFDANAEESARHGLSNTEFVLGRLRELLTVVAEATIPQEANRGRRVGVVEAGRMVARQLRTIMGPEVRRTAGALATSAWRLAGSVFSGSKESPPPAVPSVGEREGAAAGALVATAASMDLSEVDLTEAVEGAQIGAEAEADGAGTEPDATPAAENDVRKLRRQLSPEDVRQLMKTLGVPRARLEHLLDQLEERGTPVAAAASVGVAAMAEAAEVGQVGEVGEAAGAAGAQAAPAPDAAAP